jgi:hypothetical protein
MKGIGGFATGVSGRLLRAMLATTAMVLAVATASVAQTTPEPPFKDYKSFAAWVQKMHKAPFMGARAAAALQPAKQNAPASLIVKGAKNDAATLTPTTVEEDAESAAAVSNTSVQVNQDRNPWQKVTVAAAVDPKNAKHLVALTDDFRDGFERVFYHVSTNGGKKWTDDYLPDGHDANLGGAAFTMQRSPKVSFDSEGDSFITRVSSNNIVSVFNNDQNYLNMDSQIDLIQGFKNGAYLSQTPIAIATANCSISNATSIDCPSVLDMPGITTDNNPNSPNNGVTYVYYTEFCNEQVGLACDGGVAGQTSGIVEWDNGGTVQDPFNPMQHLVSGNHKNAQFSTMVIDSHGTPHIFFLDFTTVENIAMYESTLTNGEWVVSNTPVALYFDSETKNPAWNFDRSGSLAPSCAIQVDTAYCVYAATQIPGGVGGSLTGTATFGVTVDTIAATGSQYFIDDSGGFHLFPSITITPNGNHYIGWYDNRNDPTGTQLQYFLLGATPAGERALSPLFNPCTGVPGCSYFGDYDQLVSGPDNVVHATWADTRDGVSMQIYGEALE